MLKIAVALALAAAIADSPQAAPPTRHSAQVYDTRTIARAISLSVRVAR
jgi:hypothetical protein